MLFSAGIGGAVYAWNLENLFSSEYQEQQAALNLKKQKGDTNPAQQKLIDKKEYILYISYKTPWFTEKFISCLCDLKNLNKLASGSDDKVIRLWDLDE
jgi:WD40 repeat protein